MKLALPSAQAFPMLGLAPAAPDSGIDVRRMVGVFISRLPLIAGAVAVCLAGAVVYLIRTPKMYASNSVLEVRNSNRNILSPEAANQSEMNALEEQHTFEQSLTNRMLLIAVARSLNLDRDPKLFPGQTSVERPTDAQVAKAVTPLVQAELRRGTRLVDLKTTYFDAETAKAIADKVIELFVQQGMNTESGAANAAGNALNKEAERLRERLTESEKSLQEFKEKNNGIPQDEGYSLSLERLKELNSQFSKAKGQRLQLEADIAKLNTFASADPGALLQVSAIGSVPEIVELQKAIAMKDAQFSALKEWCQRRHPRYIQAEREMTNLIASRDAALRSAESRIRTAYESAMESEAKLQTAIAEQEQKSLELSKLAIPFAQLQNEVRANRELYETVTRRLKETSVAAGFGLANFRVSVEPIVQTDAISPKKSQILALAMIAGLMLGSGAAFGLEIAKPKSAAKGEEAPTPEIPVLAELPLIATENPALALDCANRRNSPECRAYRTLRSSLIFLRQDREPRSIVVTGASKDGEAGMCALNLAATYAGEGLRTLVIELDFKSNDLEKALLDDCDVMLPGLTDGLASGLSVGGFCHPTKIPNLFLIPAGQPVKDPESLLLSPTFRELMMLAWNSLDRIILSAPPVMEMAEPLVPLRYAEAVCLVSRPGRTSKSQLAEATRRLNFPGHSPGGLVLTGATPRLAASKVRNNPVLDLLTEPVTA